FAGLILCAYCGYYLSASTTDGKYTYYRCYSKFAARVRQHPHCKVSRNISERKIQAWVNARLAEMLELNEYDYFARDDQQTSMIERAKSLRVEINEVETQAKRLIQKQAIASEALASLYDAELQSLAQRLKILRSNLLETEQRVSRGDMSG